MKSANATAVRANNDDSKRGKEEETEQNRHIHVTCHHTCSGCLVSVVFAPMLVTRCQAMSMKY